MPPTKPDSVAISGLLAGATVWGLIWYPYRMLEQAGISGALAATLTYGGAMAGGLILLRRHLRHFKPSWLLLLIGLTAGGCNLGYVLATLHGEVMRVLLLFYLAPLWTVLLSRLLLNERLSAAGAGVIALSLGGAATMLWQAPLAIPVPRGLAEWLGLASGFLFALSNVLVRMTPQLSIEVKSLSVFGGVILLGLLALMLTGTPLPPLPSLLVPQIFLMLALLSVVLLAINLAVQYGLSHTPANQAIVIFLFELVVAALSSWLLAEEVMTLKEWLGGAMIVAASLFSGSLGKPTKEQEDLNKEDRRTREML